MVRGRGARKGGGRRYRRIYRCFCIPAADAEAEGDVFYDGVSWMGLAEIRGHLGFVGVEYGSSRHRLAARSGVRCALGRLVRCAVAPHRKMRDKADLPSPHVVVEKPRGDAQGERLSATGHQPASRSCPRLALEAVPRWPGRRQGSARSLRSVGFHGRHRGKEAARQGLLPCP